MIDSIKNLFSGILSFFVGLFGGKKSQEDQLSLKASEKPALDNAKKQAAASKNRKRSGYFMELEEEDTNPLNGIQSAQNAAAKALETVKDTAAKTLDTAKDTAAKTLDTAKDTAAKTLDTAKDATTKTVEKVAPAKSNKPQAVAANKSAKSEPVAPTKKEAATPEPVAAQAAKVELVQTAKGVAPVPAKPASSVASNNGQKPTETTFAPKYLIPTSSNSRRRPGPNMNPFLDMARQVKTPG